MRKSVGWCSFSAPSLLEGRRYNRSIEALTIARQRSPNSAPRAARPSRLEVLPQILLDPVVVDQRVVNMEEGRPRALHLLLNFDARGTNHYLQISLFAGQFIWPPRAPAI